MNQNPTAHPWARGVVAMATKHGKEQQFSPAFERALEMQLVVSDVDTDELGTFTGEVPRSGTAIETVRRKAMLGVARAGTRFGLASEGSFGPHPHLQFIAVGTEVAMFVDARDGIEVVEHQMYAETNFGHIVIDNPDVPDSFLRAARFPDHALVVSPGIGVGPFNKGVQDLGGLQDAVERSLDVSGRAAIQTDMRAHLNPTRQRCLVELAERLATRLAARCPQCGVGGWGIVDVAAGLPCEWCDRPTALIAADQLACAAPDCDHRETRHREGLAPAGSCQHCNP